MANAKPKASRLIGIDYGLARIGIAISDERKIIARPLLTLTAEKKLESTASKLWATLEASAAEEGYVIEELVFGLPLHMNGKRGVLADEVIHFTQLVQKHFSGLITLWDERLSSVQAERSMIEANLSRKRRSQLVDTVAAVIILQSYLDSKCG